MSDTTVALTVGKDSYGGWETLRVCRGLEQLAGVFDLSVTDKWAGQNVSRAINAGVTSSLALNGTTVVTGYIDGVKTNRDSDSHAISFKGADSTGDLVDCVVPGPPYFFSQMKLETIVKRWCQPFGIKVKVQTDTGSPLPAFSVNPEKKVYEALAYLARIRGVLLLSDGQGNLVLTESGTQVAPTALKVGSNTLSAEAETDLRDRFSVYHVYSQLVQADVASMSAASMNMSGLATDPLMTRFRPIALQSESSVDLKYSQKRAEWERTIRAARSQKVTLGVLGWSHATGLWQPNTLVPVTYPDINMDNELRLISQVTYILDAKGARTEIVTVGRHAYDKLTEPQDALLMSAQL